MTAQRANPWPELPLTSWQPTRDTFILWLQIIGKVRLARTPVLQHWWNTTLYLTATGLITSLIPGDRGRSFSVELDLLDHRLDVLTTAGERSSMPLAPMSVRRFYTRFMAMLADLDLETSIWPVPVELPDAIPFPEDDQHASYDPTAVTTFWRTMVEVERVFNEFRARFIGKSSPTHLFWGALDLVTTRFSGREAPPHPGGAPNCGPHVMQEAYSREVSSAGYWPGGEGEGIFYSYAYPEPPGYRDTPVHPRVAHWDADLGEFVLPYRTVRTADDPDATLLEFLQSTYRAAADTAKWDRALLERPTDQPR